MQASQAKLTHKSVQSNQVSAPVDLHQTSSTAPAVRSGATPGFRLGYRPGLDGLRGAAILGVVGVHSQLLQNRAAFIGVDAFFVLSGFLITCLLMEEWDRLGTISLKQFYLRRALRLLPALAAMLGVFVAYRWLFSERRAAIGASLDGLIALFYSSNWGLALRFGRPEMFGHTWSLSIEEQFYLVWPLALVLLLRRTSSRRSFLSWVFLGIFLTVVNRCLLVVAGSNWYRLTYGTDCRADALLLGCAVGVIFSSELLRDIPSVRWGMRGLAYTGVLGLAGLAFSGFGFEADFCVVYFAIPLCAAFILAEVVRSETGLLARALARPWLVYLGKISYGLYLWHYPIFCEVQARHYSLAKELIIEVLLTAVAVLASYYLLERPMLRLKSRFTPRMARNPVTLEQVKPME